MTVADRCDRQNEASMLFWNKVQGSNDEAVKSERELCYAAINNCVFSGTSDAWKWLGKGADQFTVKAVKDGLQKEEQDRPEFVMEWCKWVPSKVNIFVWRAEMDRIASKAALERRNIHVPRKSCVFCDYFLESADHLFSGCIFAAGVWAAIATWCGLPPFITFSLRDIVSMYQTVGLKGVKKTAFQGIMYTAMWLIWKSRNDHIFSDKKLKVPEVVSEIKSLSFLWFRCRSKYGCIDWESWCKFEVM